MKYVITFTLALLIGVLGFAAVERVKEKPVQNLGGSLLGNYFSTTTVAATTAGTYYLTETASTSLGHVIGQLVIASSTSVAGFKIEDANGKTTSTLATFQASPNTGTYIFDRILRYGLSVTVPSGFNGSFTIQYR